MMKTGGGKAKQTDAALQRRTKQDKIGMYLESGATECKYMERFGIHWVEHRILSVTLALRSLKS